MGDDVRLSNRSVPVLDSSIDNCDPIHCPPEEEASRSHPEVYFFHHGGGPDLHNYILRSGHLFMDLSDALRFSGTQYMPGSCLFFPSPSDISRNLGLVEVSDVIV